MNPKQYFDIDVNVAATDTGMSPPMLRGRLLSILHPFFVQQPHTYALAIPAASREAVLHGGGRLRVFASNRDQLDALASDLTALPWVRDYAQLHYPCMVPAHFTGSWATFRRFRVPTLKTDRKTGEEYGQLRQRRMTLVDTNRMEYFILFSQSTGQRFSLVIQKEPGCAPQTECFPNSYGFCTTQTLFSVPDLP